MSKTRPIVLLPTNIVDYNGSPGHILRDTYVRAIIDVAGGFPLALPSAGRDVSLAEIKPHIAGIVLTGSVTNVAPACYGEKQVFDDKLLDLARDATTLPLIRDAIDADIPLLAICRGFQEMNVAMGGSLHQKVQELPGKLDHRPLPGASITDAYERQAHKVSAERGGLFERIGITAPFTVNTVHEQGIDRLGSGLHVEAIAEDGLVEAISVPGKTFALGVQWHPEGDLHINPVSRKIISAFGKAIGA